MRIWSEVTGQKASYRQITEEQLMAISPDKPFGAEVADMFTYCNSPGYDGGMDLLTAEDMRKVCLETGLFHDRMLTKVGGHRLSNDRSKSVHQQAGLDQFRRLVTAVGQSQTRRHL